MLIWCPFPGEAEARRVAGQLLDEKLVACVNIMPGMISLFAWDGERGEAEETGVLFKTDAASADMAIDRLARLHSYETPAIMGWKTCSSTAATRAWLGGLSDRKAD